MLEPNSTQPQASDLDASCWVNVSNSEAKRLIDNVLDVLFLVVTKVKILLVPDVCVEVWTKQQKYESTI